MISFVKRYSIYFAWCIALIATIGSLYVSNILNMKPCVFCWYQRIFMFPLAIILGIAVYKKNRKIGSYVIALPILGGVIAFTQSIFSYFNIASLVCGFDCLEKTSKLFGFFDMSIASFFAFGAITFFLIFANKKKK
ncbi:MAG: Disulfide bond formation protein C [Candidatus Anoxychlamydiales bacterium]|nr:Disulfide bond formation protein C [Candidatus Anoxychlamydiales bacterium]